MPEAFIEKLITEHPEWFDPEKKGDFWGLDQMGPEMDCVAYVPCENFAENFREIFQSDGFSRRTFFAGVFVAYSNALGREIKEQMVIAHSTHCRPARFAEYLEEDFTDVKYLFTIREPVQNMGSMYKSTPDSEYRSGEVFTRMLNDTAVLPPFEKFHGCIAYSNETAERSKAIRLEDIHNSSKKVMSAVARWIDVPWDDSLLESTFNGLKWWSRPGASKRVSGFDKKIVEKKHKNLFSSFDRIRLETLIVKRCERWQYPHLSGAANLLFKILAPLLFLWPFRIEFLSCRESCIMRVLRIAESKHLFDKDEKGTRSGKNVLSFSLAARIVLFPVLILRYIAIRYLRNRKALFRAWRADITDAFQFVDLLEMEEQ